VRRAGTAAGAVTVWRAAAAGILVGLGFAVKVTVALAGLGLAIALVMRLGRQRRVVAPLAALGAGFAVTAGAAVAIGGSAMLRQSSQASSMVSIGSPWRVIRTVIHLVVGGTAATDIVKAGAIALTVVLAVLLIRGIPGIRDDPAGPAAGPAAAGVVFALVLAWLFAWPYVLPWYDALGWALLPLIPLVSAPVVDGIGWLLLARTAALGFGYLPARATDVTMPPGLTWLQPVIRHGVTPVILAGATVWLVVLMVRSGHRRPSWPPGAVTLLGVLAWVAALAAVAPLVRGYLTSPPDQRMVDLDVYRTGGLSVLQGQPLYTMLTQPPQLLPFTYPPTAALFAVPLALLPWPVAQLVWVPVIYGPLAVVIWFAFAPLLRRAGSGRMQAVVFAVLFAACAYLFPLRDEMRFGQVDMALLAMALADCAARAPRWPRGALVGLATAIKLVPGVFIVYLWLSGRRRAAVTAAIVALAWTLGAWLVLPQDSTTYWTSVIFQSGRLGSNAGTSNQSLRGILLREFLPGQAPGVVWAVLALAVAVAGFAVVSRLARESRQTEAIAVTALLGVLLSPVSWIHHFLVVVVVIGAILADGRSPRRTAIAAGTAVFFALTVPWAGQVLLGVHDVPVQAARVVQDAFGLAALALLVVIARLPAAPDAAKKCHPGQSAAAAASAPNSGQVPA
jgi:alpha-1,2-mannosyltransferase